MNLFIIFAHLLSHFWAYNDSKNEYSQTELKGVRLEQKTGIKYKSFTPEKPYIKIHD
jgi:hypothetical protein